MKRSAKASVSLFVGSLSGRRLFRGPLFIGLIGALSMGPGAGCGGSPPPAAATPTLTSAVATADAEPTTEFNAASTLAPPAPLAMPEALSAAMEQVRALLEAPDAPVIQAAFSPSFLAETPAPKAVEVFREIRRASGPCRDHRALTIEGTTRAVLVVECENGELDVTLRVEPSPPHRIEVLFIRPREL